MSLRRSAAYLAAPLAVLSIVGSACGRDASASVARELGAVKVRLDGVHREIRAPKPAEPTTRGSVQTRVRRMKNELPRYEPIRGDALAAQDEAEDVDDEDVRSAADLLVEMVRHRHDVMRSFVQAVERESLTQQLQLLELPALEDEETKRMDEEWAELAPAAERAVRDRVDA
jgi:hypothetical protein